MVRRGLEASWAFLNSQNPRMLTDSASWGLPKYPQWLRFMMAMNPPSQKQPAILQKHLTDIILLNLNFQQCKYTTCFEKSVGFILIKMKEITQCQVDTAH